MDTKTIDQLRDWAEAARNSEIDANAATGARITVSLGIVWDGIFIRVSDSPHAFALEGVVHWVDLKDMSPGPVIEKIEELTVAVLRKVEQAGERT